jgi:hypothetical protein
MRLEAVIVSIGSWALMNRRIQCQHSVFHIMSLTPYQSKNPQGLRYDGMEKTSARSACGACAGSESNVAGRTPPNGVRRASNVKGK